MNYARLMLQLAKEITYPEPEPKEEYDAAMENKETIEEEPGDLRK